MREFPIPIPRRMATLAVDKRGYPVPAFVAWFDGEPDFRVVNPDHMVRCVRGNKCWICGEQMGVHKAFVIGPMCCINRISSEPPSHLDCAEFAAQACPFLSQPLAKRPDLDKRPAPGETKPPAGVMLAHNPGVTAVWQTRGYTPVQAPGGVLFEVGEPDKVTFWAKGRHASGEEIAAAIEKGLPFLADMAAKDGPAAKRALEKQVTAFHRLVAKLLPDPDLPDVDLSSFAVGAQ